MHPDKLLTLWIIHPNKKTLVLDGNSMATSGKQGVHVMVTSSKRVSESRAKQLAMGGKRVNVTLTPEVVLAIKKLIDTEKFRTTTEAISRAIIEYSGMVEDEPGLKERVRLLEEKVDKLTGGYHQVTISKPSGVTTKKPSPVTIREPSGGEIIHQEGGNKKCRKKTEADKLEIIEFYNGLKADPTLGNDALAKLVHKRFPHLFGNEGSSVAHLAKIRKAGEIE